ncbi:MAG TPA: peptide chain release factor-like protein [Phycisphaerae bacterium]|jgi:hypothetical protein
MQTVPVANGGATEYLLLDDQHLLAQCEVHTHRVHGPGGQHRNKTESAVRLRHRPTGVVVTASERRSQHQNRANAVERLREALALQVRRAIDVQNGPLRPSGFFCACLTPEGRLRVSQRNERYPLVVAEVLDVLAALQTRVSDAAATLGLTTANLVAFIQADEKLWKRVNEMRAASGQKPLR